MSKKVIDIEIYRDQLKDGKKGYRTQSLLFEYNTTSLKPVFTTKDYDHTVRGVKYPSLKLIYLEIADPTEYEFAIQVFGSWDHWIRFTNNGLIKPHVESWRRELEVKIKSNAIKNVIKQSSRGNVNASRWIAERGWEPKRGRPSKLEIEKEKKIQAGIADDIKQDLKNLGLH